MGLPVPNQPQTSSVCMTGILVPMFRKFPKRHPSKESEAPTQRALRVEIEGGDDRALNQEIEYG